MLSEIVLFGLICGGISQFLYDAIWSGIFSFWGRFLEKKFYDLDRNEYSALAYPLGACIYCMNVYVVAACLLAYEWNWYYLFGGVGISTALIKFLQK